MDKNLGKVRGDSAYETWLKQSGNSGKTEAQFLKSLKGGIDDLYDYQILDGSYVFKYSDGRMIMYSTWFISSECSINYGGWYRSDHERWVFPVPFVLPPMVNITCVGGVDYGFAISASTSDAMNDNQITFCIATPENYVGTNKKALVSVYVEGRWK